MAILNFIRRASRRDLWRMLWLTVVAGLANALLVVVINQVAGLVAEGKRPDIWAGMIFAGAFSIYYFCERLALLRANTVIERLLRDLRIEVVDKLRRSDLRVVDQLGRGNLYAVVSQGTNQLSVTFPLLVENFQQSVLLVVSLIYLGYLSIPALLVFLIAVPIGFAGFLHLKQDFQATLRQVAERQAEMLDVVGGVVLGHKELRLNVGRSEAIYQSFQHLSQLTQLLLVKIGDHTAAMVLLASLVLYGMLAVVGFVFPQYIDMHSTLMFQLIPTLLFCISPLVKIVAQSPMFMQAEVGLGAILSIEQNLAAGGSLAPEEARARSAKYRHFKQIRYAGIGLTYLDRENAPLFTVGPCDLTLNRGETVFLVGGNGSGKSTMTRLITGLYGADRGEIAVDNVPVEGKDIAGMRELFSAIFADFHLFDRLYGQEDADPEWVRQQIADMGLEGKVGFEAGRFTDLDLSTGQRKRLALIAALLEDRPIYVFDEWSAEQDVLFREQFYTRIIPALKSRGKTVLAVTHDDRYWHLADRVIKLDLGSVVWERKGSELSDLGNGS
jgi:putative ATP-binding cassette transporter